MTDINSPDDMAVVGEFSIGEVIVGAGRVVRTDPRSARCSVRTTWPSVSRGCWQLVTTGPNAGGFGLLRTAGATPRRDAGDPPLICCMAITI
ncbi:MAG: hypothetical protein ACSLFA_13605 [Mycobacterium sp.]